MKRVFLGLVLIAVLLLAVWLVLPSRQPTTSPPETVQPRQTDASTPDTRAVDARQPADSPTSSLDAEGALPSSETADTPIGSPVEQNIEQQVPLDGIVVASTVSGYTPLPHALVFVGHIPETPDATNAHAQTGQDGTFHLDWGGDAAGLVYAWHPDYAPGWQPLPPETAPDRRVRIVLTQGGEVEGHVTLDGQPVANASVQIEAYNKVGKVRTDSAGAYTLSPVTPGELLVVATLPESNRSLLRMAVVEGKATTAVDFDFARTNATLTGSVYVEGQPAKSGTLRLSITDASGNEERFTTTIQSGGAYAFESLPSGSATITAAVPIPDGGNASRLLTLSIPDGGPVTRDIDISLGTVIGGTITIPETVRDGVVALVKGDIVIEELSLEWLSQLEPLIVAAAPVKAHSYRFEGLDPGTYTVIALAYTELANSDADGMASMIGTALFASKTIEVAEGSETQVDLAPTR